MTYVYYHPYTECLGFFVYDSLLKDWVGECASSIGPLHCLYLKDVPESFGWVQIGEL